jgi:hypothetical protein
MTGFVLPEQRDLPPGRLDTQRVLLVTEVERARTPRARRRHLRLALVLAAVLATVLLVTPAFGIGPRILDLLRDLPPSPEQAQEQTGIAPDVHLETTYEGQSFAVLTYVAPDGRLCIAERLGGGTGYGCFERGELFRDGPVWFSGPGAMQSERGDPTLWDRMWFSGLAQPEVARLEVVMTDCSRRPVPLDGDGVFLFAVPPADLHAPLWPYRLLAFGREGAVVDTKRIRTDVPDTPQAREAGTLPPRPPARCR